MSLLFWSLSNAPLCLPVCISRFLPDTKCRSGHAAVWLQRRVTVLNSPGTIDADYRGEVKVILVNLSSEPFTVTKGERIAQLVLAKHETIEWEEVEELSESLRAEGGFGSTGVK